MYKKIKLNSFSMPNFITLGNSIGKRQEGFKMSIPVHELTEEEAKEYSELIKQTFMEHWATVLKLINKMDNNLHQKEADQLLKEIGIDIAMHHAMKKIQFFRYNTSSAKYWEQVLEYLKRIKNNSSESNTTYNFDNEERIRYYGLRKGDLVSPKGLDDKEWFKGICEVIDYCEDDNNKVLIKSNDGTIKEWIAEWCDIVTKVEDRI